MKKILLVLLFIGTAQASLDVEIVGQESSTSIDISSPVQKTIQINAVGASHKISRQIRFPDGVEVVSDACSLQTIEAEANCQIIVSFDKADISDNGGTFLIKYDDAGEVKISQFRVSYLKEAGQQLQIVYGAVGGEVVFEPMNLLSNSKKRIKIQNVGNTKTGKIGQVYNQLPKGLEVVYNRCQLKELEPLESCYMMLKIDSSAMFAGEQTSQIQFFEEPSGNTLLSFDIRYDFTGERSVDANSSSALDISKRSVVDIQNCLTQNPDDFMCLFSSESEDNNLFLSDSHYFCEQSTPSVIGSCFYSSVFKMASFPIQFPILIKAKTNFEYTAETREPSSGGYFNNDPGFYNYIAYFPMNYFGETFRGKVRIRWADTGLDITSTEIYNSLAEVPACFDGGDGWSYCRGDYQGPGAREDFAVYRVQTTSGTIAGTDDLTAKYANSLSISSSNINVENIFIYEENDLSFTITNTSNETGLPIVLNSLMSVVSPNADVSFKDGSCNKGFLAPNESCEMIVTIKPNKFQTGGTTYPVTISLPGFEQTYSVSAENIVRRGGVFDEDFYGHALFQ